MKVFSNDSFILLGVVFIILTFLTLVFSSITILIIVCNWKHQFRSLNNLFACNSSASLFFYAIAIAIQIPFIFHTDEQQNNFTVCKIRAFIYVYACAVKCYSYLIQAISRWFITVHYRHRTLLEFRTNILMIVASWILALITTACLLISPKAYQYEPECRLCVLTSKVFLTSFVPSMIIFFIPACTIVVLYGVILCHTAHVHHVHPHGFTRITNKRNVQVYRNIFILIGIVLTGGIPYSLSVIWNGIARSPPIMYPIAVIFIGIGAAMESLAIFLSNHQVKKLLLKKIGFKCRRKVGVIH